MSLSIASTLKCDKCGESSGSVGILNPATVAARVTGSGGGQVVASLTYQICDACVPLVAPQIAAIFPNAPAAAS